MALYTYTPKIGDVVRFPNGVEVNYTADKQLVVIHPDPDVTFSLRDVTNDGQNMILIGASK